jgi:ATP-binding cassette subfamily F protein uup
VLEDRLDEYKGTLIVVSHDRMFLDSVVTSVFAFETGGRIERYVGGYSDWLRQGRTLAESDNPNQPRGVAAPAEGETQGQKAGRRQGRKLSYKDQRELDALTSKIESLEAEIRQLERKTTAKNFYDKPWHETVPVLDGLKAKQAELEAATARWLALEELKSSDQALP